MVRISSTVVLTLLTFASPVFADDSTSGSATTEAKPAQAGDANKTEAKSDVAAPAAPAAEPTIMLHVKSDTAVTIEREDTGEVVCTSPCNKEVPAAQRYRVGGARPSSSFVLDARSGAAKLNVDPASNKEFYGGVAGLAVGTGLIAAGVITLALGYANSNDVPGADGTVTNTGFTDTMFIGTVLVLTGVAAGIWGGATTIANYRTTVKGSVMKDPPARGGNPAPTNRASLSFGRPSSDAFKSMAGPSFSVPILGGVF